VTSVSSRSSLFAGAAVTVGICGSRLLGSALTSLVHLALAAPLIAALNLSNRHSAHTPGRALVAPQALAYGTSGTSRTGPQSSPVDLVAPERPPGQHDTQ